MSWIKDNKNQLIITGGLFVIGAIFILKSKLIITMNNKIKLQEANPKAKSAFEKLVSGMEAKGWTVIITSLYRDFAKQDSLHKENSKNAVAGLSSHNYGMGIDINLSKGNVFLRKDSPTKAWTDSGVVALANSLGLRWGGNAFKNYNDNVHFEITKEGDTTKYLAQAKKMFGNKYLTVEANKVNWG
jgi:hypothetical protein